MDWSISFNTSPFEIILVLVVSFILSYFYYRITIPKLSSLYKYLLIILRAISFALIIFLILELTINIVNIDLFKPKTFIFIDNSKSISTKDSAATVSAVNNILEILSDKNSDDFDIFTFGEKLNKINPKQFDYNPNEKFTNLESIANKIKSAGDTLNSVLIISDGNINNGSTSADRFKDLNTPVFTFGLSSKKNENDIIVKEVLYNSFVYRNKNTEIQAVIYNDGFQNRKIKCGLYENQTLINEKIITFSETNINKVIFNYTSAKSGKKNLEIRTDILPTEINKANNQKYFEINAIEDKLSIAFISSIPTTDFSVIKLAAEADTNRFIFNYFDGKQSNIDLVSNSLDKADILFLFGFPSTNSSNPALNSIFNFIVERKKPFFILFNNYTDFTKVSALNKILPFSIKLSDNKYAAKSITFNNSAAGFISSNPIDENSFWNNLPPLSINNLYVNPENNAIVLAATKDKQKNPVIILGNKNYVKSFSILGFDIWRWVLQNSNVSKENFNIFFDRIIKWLNAPIDSDRFRAKPIKPTFFENEEIILQAELYDNKFLPVENAEISLTLNDSSNSLNSTFDYVGNGLYEARINSKFNGKVFYYTEVKNEFNNKIFYRGSFRIDRKEIETINTGVNENLLKNISFSSGGEYIEFGEIKNILTKLEKLNSLDTKSVRTSENFEVWQNKIILILILVLLLTEWLIRKLNYLN